jgi:hypothetical protein
LFHYHIHTHVYQWAFSWCTSTQSMAIHNLIRSFLEQSFFYQWSNMRSVHINLIIKLYNKKVFDVYFIPLVGYPSSKCSSRDGQWSPVVGTKILRPRSPRTSVEYVIVALINLYAPLNAVIKHGCISLAFGLVGSKKAKSVSGLSSSDERNF